MQDYFKVLFFYINLDNECSTMQWCCARTFSSFLDVMHRISLPVWPRRPQLGDYMWCCLTLSHTWNVPTHNFRCLCCHGCFRLYHPPPHSADPTLSDTPCFLQNASFAHSGNYISRVRGTHRWKDIIKTSLLQNSYSATWGRETGVSSPKWKWN